MSIPLLKIPTQTATTKPYIKQGDTIPAYTVTFGDSYDIDLTTSTVKMQIYDGDTTIINITNGSGITIDSAKVFTVDEVSASDNNLPVGCFLGDLQVTEADGTRTTYFNVEYTIIQQYTR